MEYQKTPTSINPAFPPRPQGKSKGYPPENKNDHAFWGKKFFDRAGVFKFWEKDVIFWDNFLSKRPEYGPPGLRFKNFWDKAPRTLKGKKGVVPGERWSRFDDNMRGISTRGKTRRISSMDLISHVLRQKEPKRFGTFPQSGQHRFF